jgi:DNA invertase Pin-like site-specific DNA recombinase
MVQLAGHDMLRARGVTLIAASAPTHFVEDTPTAVLVRQVLGAVAEFEKTTLVAKLAAARRRTLDIWPSPSALLEHVVSSARRAPSPSGARLARTNSSGPAGRSSTSWPR